MSRAHGGEGRLFGESKSWWKIVRFCFRKLLPEMEGNGLDLSPGGCCNIAPCMGNYCKWTVGKPAVLLLCGLPLCFCADYSMFYNPWLTDPHLVCLPM